MTLDGLKRNWPWVAGAAAVVALAGLTVGSRARITGESPAERIASICTLADRQPWGAAEVLGRAATGEPDPAVRRAAVLALAKLLPDGRAAIEAATRDEAREVRAAAALALGACGDAAAANELGRMINDPGEDTVVCCAAATALVDNTSPEALVLLVDAMDSHGRPEVANHAAAALIRRFQLIQVPPRPDAVAEYRRQKRRLWLDMVETIKRMPQTRAAYQQVGRRLVLRPENVLPRPKGH